jgi:hypothetical protein
MLKIFYFTHWKILDEKFFFFAEEKSKKKKKGSRKKKSNSKGIAHKRMITNQPNVPLVMYRHAQHARPASAR